MAVHCLSGHWCLISGTTSFLMMTSILVITLPIYPLVCFFLIQAEELQPGYSVSNYMFVAKVRERTAWRSFWVHYIKCGWPLIWISFSSLVLRWSWGISGCLEILQLGIITAYCYQRGEPRQWECEGLTGTEVQLSSFLTFLCAINFFLSCRRTIRDSVPFLSTT